ncbi:MAG: thiamine pyrophosphate-binding protein [Nitrospinae bacterium]|nr:thiamine pyrophosphate-binding protein [Nitrospinota bacterium]
MSSLTAGQAVIEALRVEGVRYIFGVVGSCYVEVLDALYAQPDIQFMGVRHEQVAAHMADGYARVAGLPGVCLATNGPGATNLVTGVASAYMNHAPVIVITGAPMISQMLRDSFQELDQLTLFRPVTKAQLQIQRADRIPELFRHAFRVAMAGKKGPVLVDLPRDMLNETIDATFLPPARYRWNQRDAGDTGLIGQAVEVLAQATRPVLIAGGGVIWSRAQAEVLEVAERLTAPVVTSYGRNDAVPHDHPLVIGALGRAGSPEAAEAVRAADAILAVGTRLTHFTTFYDHRFIPPHAKIIQIEVDEKELGRHYPLEVGILGDAKAVLNGLLAGLRKALADKRRDEARFATVQTLRQQRQARVAAARNMDIVPLKPQRVYWELRQILPRDAIVVLDAGAAASHAYNLLDFYEARTFITPGDLGCVGAGFPSALGAKLARPDRPVVCLCGDGGFLMTGQDLETAVRERIPVVTVVMSNNCWGSEKAYQKYFFNERYVGADFSNPRFDEYARLFGAQGLRAEKPEELRPTLEKALGASIPTVVEIPVDPDELPFPARSDAVRSRDERVQ